MSIRKYIKNDWNVICDVCGRKRKRHEVTLAYGSGITPVVVSCLDGCADELHPLNFPPPVIFDGRPVPDARPDATENNTETFVADVLPSYMSWGHFVNAGAFGYLNYPNNDFNLNGQWEWGYFIKR